MSRLLTTIPTPDKDLESSELLSENTSGLDDSDFMNLDGNVTLNQGTNLPKRGKKQLPMILIQKIIQKMIQELRFLLLHHRQNRKKREKIQIILTQKLWTNPTLLPLLLRPFQKGLENITDVVWKLLLL